MRFLNQKVKGEAVRWTALPTVTQLLKPKGKSKNRQLFCFFTFAF